MAAILSTVSTWHIAGFVLHVNKLSRLFSFRKVKLCFLSSSSFQVTFFSVTVSLFKLLFYCSLPLGFKKNVQRFTERGTTLCLLWNYTIHYSQQVRVIERGCLSVYTQMEPRCDKASSFPLFSNISFSLQLAWYWQSNKIVTKTSDCYDSI